MIKPTFAPIELVRALLDMAVMPTRRRATGTRVRDLPITLDKLL